MSVRRPSFRAPASVMIARAQVTFLAAILVPTVASTALGIVVLAIGEGGANLLVGVLLLAFCTTTLTGYILGTNFLTRGASLAHVQNDFVSTVSHELRTPLTSIRMFIETLQSERLTDPNEKKDCLRLLAQEVDRLQGLVTKVIELSRWETGRVAVDLEMVDLGSVVADAVDALRASTLSRPVEIKMDLAEAIEVEGDGASLTLAVSNLLTNAWKYGTEGREGGIRVKLEGTDKEVVISVADDGPGIPWTEQRKIFDQFERGRSAMDNRSIGSGLGLAIVRAIVHAHGGKVELRSFPGRGSEFRIRLPRESAP